MKDSFQHRLEAELHPGAPVGSPDGEDSQGQVHSLGPRKQHALGTLGANSSGWGQARASLQTSPNS